MHHIMHVLDAPEFVHLLVNLSAWLFFCLKNLILFLSSPFISCSLFLYCPSFSLSGLRTLSLPPFISFSPRIFVCISLSQFLSYHGLFCLFLFFSCRSSSLFRLLFSFFLSDSISLSRCFSLSRFLSFSLIMFIRFCFQVLSF